MLREDLLVFLATVFHIINVGLVIIGLQVIFIGVVPDMYIAVLSTVYWIPILVFSPLWGYLADATGQYKKVMTSTLVLFAAITYMHAVFTDYVSILILRFLSGLFSAAYTPIMQAYMTLDIEYRVFGKKIATYNTAVAVGFLSSGYLTSIVLFYVSPVSIFYFAALSTMVSAFMVSLLPRKHGHRRIVNVGEAISSLFSLRAVKILRKRRAHFLVFGLAVRHIAIMGMFSLIYVYMQRRGIPEYLLGILSSFNNIMQVLLIPIFGVLVDRIGRKKVFVPGFVLSSMIPLFFINAITPLDFAIAFSFIGIGYALLISGANPYLRDAAPRGEESEILSLANTTRAFGMIFGPIIVGTLVAFFSYEAMFYILFVIGILASLMAMVSQEQYGYRQIRAL